MIKAIYICDKCNKEKETEFKSNGGVSSCPDGWSRPEVKLSYQSTKAFLFCGDCAFHIGFDKYGSLGSGSVDSKETSAEKLVDLLFEIADERGLLSEQ
jgi:hypothetical protein